MTDRAWLHEMMATMDAAAVQARPVAVEAKPRREPVIAEPLDVLAARCPCDDCRGRSACAAGLACFTFSLYASGASEARWSAAPRHDADATKFEAIFGGDNELSEAA
jgi:hypothetical protein